jgi:hypothetical protein
LFSAAVGGCGAKAVFDGTAPTDRGACKAVCAGIWLSRFESVWGVMTEASHRYSSS